MKRFWQPASAAHDLSHHHEPLEHETPSLKRVRLATSAGELRLERDLHHMTMHGGWKRLGNRRWESTHGFVIERREDPLEFVLHMSHHTQVWMQLSRLYPHQPPMITHVVHPRIQHVIVSVESPVNAYAVTTHCHSTALVYNRWSPVVQLGDFLDFLVEGLSKHGDRNVVTPTLLSDNDSLMQEETGVSLELETVFTPNRFDWGYPKPGDQIMEV